MSFFLHAATILMLHSILPSTESSNPIDFNSLEAKDQQSLLLDASIDNDVMYGISFGYSNEEANIISYSGDLASDESYPIASVTKMFTTAVILQLVDEGEIALHDTVDMYLEDLNFQREVTIQQLLDQTSELPEFLNTNTYNGYIAESYNTDLLSFEERLALSSTTFPNDAPHFVYVNHNPVNVTKVIKTYVASGGLLSNTEDLLTFGKGFYDGSLFNLNHLDHITFLPIQFDYHYYSMGQMEIRVDPVLSFFGIQPLVGHLGASGSFLFKTEDDIIIAGTSNQATDAKATYQFIYRMFNETVN